MTKVHKQRQRTISPMSNAKVHYHALNSRAMRCQRAHGPKLITHPKRTSEGTRESQTRSRINQSNSVTRAEQQRKCWATCATR